MNAHFFYESPLVKKTLWTLVAIWTAITCYLTLAPGSLIGHVGMYQYDKFGHAGMFFGWTLLFGLARLHQKDLNNRFLLGTLLIGVGFGGLIEILQWLMPFHRDPDIKDFVADTIGSWSAFLLLNFFRERLQALTAERTDKLYENQGFPRGYHSQP